MANLYDLKKFDLNLLVIFECIYQHLSISKAAETLFITPSGVSQSLQRLRNQLNDPLFIRSGKGITPTTVGTNLHIHLEQNLNQLEQTINIMHNSKLKKNFIIYCPQIITTKVIMEPLKLLIGEHNYEIELHDMMVTRESAEDLLAYRKADLIFSFTPLQNRSITCTDFREIPFVLFCRKDHPRIGEAPDRESLLLEKFTAFLSEEPGVKNFQSTIAEALPDRNVAFRSDSYMTILSMVSTSDMIGIAPEIVYQRYADFLELRAINADFELPRLKIHMMYNRSALNSNSFSHFIAQISP